MRDNETNSLLKSKEAMIITPAKFPGDSGDTTNYMEIMNNLIENGFKLVLICPKDDKENEFHPPYQSLHVIRIPFSPPRLKSIGQKNKLKLYIQILYFLIVETAVVFRAVLKFKNYSILMRHSLLTIQLPVLLKLMNIHVVADGELVSDSLAQLVPTVLCKSLRTLERRIIQLYSFFKVSTESQAKGLIELGLPAERVLKIPVSVDMTKIPIYPVEQIRPKTFGYFGVLEIWQGVDILLEAFSILVKKVPDALLYIIGEGSSKKDLENFVAKNNLCTNVIFVGAVKREVLWNEYFQKFRTVVIPRPPQNNSIDSILPIKLIEALASGKIVIAMDIDAMREVATEGLIVVQEAKPTSLAEAMQNAATGESKIVEFSRPSLAVMNKFDIKRNMTSLIRALLER